MPLQPSFRNKSRRFWLACLCALALLGLQGLGQWHRLAHGAGLGGPPAFALNTGHASPAALADIWGHHSGDASCQLFDHLCDGQALAGPAAAIVGPASPCVVSWPAPARLDLAVHWKRGPRGPPTSA